MGVIGFLVASPLTEIEARMEVFRRSLRELGYIEQQNVIIEWRSSPNITSVAGAPNRTQGEPTCRSSVPTPLG